METRRKFLKKALYVTPLILTVRVRPTLANSAYGPGQGGSSDSNPQPSYYHKGDSHEWWEFWR